MRQIAYELDVIEQLDFPGYFLVLVDIVEFCRAPRHLLPGPGERGQQRGLLRARRHQGRRRRARPAVRAVPLARARRPARHRPRHRAPAPRGGDPVRLRQVRARPRRAGRERDHLPAALGAAGDGEGRRPLTRPRRRAHQVDRPVGARAAARSTSVRETTTAPPVPKLALDLAEQVLDFPRHLGIHSGGMVMADRPLIEFCPVEWARMENRSVLQWDKDDCAAAGLVKFDLLGLGMLTMLHLAVDLVREHEGVEVDLATIPQEPEVYALLERGRHHRRVPGGEPRPDGHAAAAAARDASTTSWWRSRSSGPVRSRVARCTRTCDAATARSRSPTRTRCSSSAWRRPSACRCSRSSSCRWRSTSPGSRPGESDRLRQAMGSKRSRARMARDARPAARGDGRARHHRRDRRRHRAQDRGLRRLRVPREPLGELRLPRVRELVDQAALPDRVRVRAAQRATDGLLLTAHHRARRHPTRRRGARPVRGAIAPRLHAGAAHRSRRTHRPARSGLARRPVDPRHAGGPPVRARV